MTRASGNHCGAETRGGGDNYILPAPRRSHRRLVTVPELLAIDPRTRGQLAAGAAGCRLAGARTNGG